MWGGITLGEGNLWDGKGDSYGGNGIAMGEDKGMERVKGGR